nr:hypothetical protein [uncultured Agathobaculum sp.]
MFEFTGSEGLFYIGLILMGIAVVGAIVSIVIFTVSGKRLKAKLEEEYGRKKH